LLASHHLLTGARRDAATLPGSLQIISESHTDRQSTFLVRSAEPILDTSWSIADVDLEDLVLAYMSGAPANSRVREPAPATAEVKQ
jgi:ABC-2 type transport system ATP-binding protein